MASAQAKTKSTQAKRWCFTLNNPTYPIQFNELTMDYLIYGEEVGKEGTPHHQGFLVMKVMKRPHQMKEINNHAHWEKAMGTNVQASDYCKKDGKYHEFGVMPLDPQVIATPAGNKANKEKWRAINDHAKAGDLEWIDQEHPKVFNQSYKNLKAMKVDYMKKKPDLLNTCGIWFYGKSGVGKTHLTTQLYPDAYLKRAQNKWFDAYQHEDVIVVDDLDDTHAYMGYELKKLADKYCYMVEVKNSSMYIRPSKCVVTSQYTIQEVWKNDPKTREALERRFQQVHITLQNRDIVYQAYKKKDESKDTILEDDVTPAMFDQLMVEAEEQRKAVTLGEKIAKQNKDIAMKRIDIEKIQPKKIRPANIYFPDKRLQFATPKPLVRKNAYVEPPPAPKKLKRERVVVISSDEEFEEPEPELTPPEYFDEREASLEELWCDEELSDSEHISSDEY